MARQVKVLDVTIADGKKLSVMVKELTVGEIIDLMNDETINSKTEGAGFAGLQAFLTRNLDKFTSLTLEQARELAPSDLRQLYDAFKEVNATFFEVAREAGLLHLLSELKTAVVTDFSNLLVGSLRRATVQRSLATDTPSSSMP